METSEIISLAAVAIALLGFILSSRKTTREDAASNARLEAKLENINTGVTDIRVDIRTMGDRVNGLTERLSAVESSCKSAHHRLDQLAGHPPDGR